MQATAFRWVLSIHERAAKSLLTLTQSSISQKPSRNHNLEEPFVTLSQVRYEALLYHGGGAP